MFPLEGGDNKMMDYFNKLQSHIVQENMVG